MMIQDTEDKLREFEIEIIHAEKTKGWWSVTLEAKNGDDYSGGKDRSFQGALRKSIDAVTEYKAKNPG